MRKINKYLNNNQRKFLNDILGGKIFRIILLEGSVRSGKTYISLFAWLILILRSPPGSKFLMCGRTLTTLKRNCLNDLQVLSDNYFKINFDKKECYFYDKIIFLEGFYDSRSENKIRGITLQGAYIDELTTCKLDFFNMLLSRLSLSKSFCLATTNPDSPSHWFYQDYIIHKSNSLKRYQFSLFDNKFLPKNYIKSLSDEYSSSEIFYNRFILGKWCTASGLIYNSFANNPSNYIINYNPKDIENIFIGIDYGASVANTAFVAIGASYELKKIYILQEKCLNSVFTPDELYKKISDFVYSVYNSYFLPNSIFCDYGALGQIITSGLKRFMYNILPSIRIKDCIKPRIIDRINLFCRLFSNNRIFIHSSCKEAIESFSNAIWDDSDTDTRLDDGTFNVDILDSIEYSVSPIFYKLFN